MSTLPATRVPSPGMGEGQGEGPSVAPPLIVETRKTADQILKEAAARAEAAFDPVAAFKLRRMADQAAAARARELQ